MINSRHIIWFCGLFIIALICSAASAQSVERSQLKKQFKERYQILSKLKEEAKIGETWQGFIAAVDPSLKEDQKAWSAIEDENRDRKVLYKLLAEEVAADLDEPKRSEISLHVIAQRNAKRNFKRASSTALLRVAKGIWVTKKDRPWLLQLQKLEAQGRIGVGIDGYVATVSKEFDRDDKIRKIIDSENKARKSLYKRIAADKDISIEKVAREHAKKYSDAAHAGVFLQADDGKWQPKPKPKPKRNEGGTKDK